MRFTYTIDNERFHQLEVSQDLEVENFLAMISMENPGFENIDSHQLTLVVNGRRWPIDSDVKKMKLFELRIGQDDLVNVMVRAPLGTSGPSSSTAVRSTGRSQMSSNSALTAAALLKMPADARAAAMSQIIKGISIPKKPKFRGNGFDLHGGIQKMVADLESPECRAGTRKLFDQVRVNASFMLHSLKDECPRLVEQFKKDSNDYEAFHCAYVEDQKDFYRRLALAQDPSSEEGQALIAEMIKRDNHREQLQKAMQDMPEAFIRSHMLYVKLKVNGAETIGFIDSGAQVTTISSAVVEKLNLGRFVDKKYANTIRGVGGEQHSDGRIHSAELDLNGHFFTAPMTVLDRVGEDVLIGLDTLRRHGACIDLNKNVLRIGKDGFEVPFLNEREYATECVRLRINCNLPTEDLEPIPTSEVDSDKVANIVAMGFSAENAVRALAKTHNNAEHAVFLLDAEQRKAEGEPGPSKASEPSGLKDEPME